jgi:hypothetical protein
MHHTINEYPQGEVKGAWRLIKQVPYNQGYLIDVIKIINGSRILFAERVYRVGSTNMDHQLVAFRASDPFMSAEFADKFIQDWLEAKTKNEGYTLSIQPNA